VRVSPERRCDACHGSGSGARRLSRMAGGETAFVRALTPLSASPPRPSFLAWFRRAVAACGTALAVGLADLGGVVVAADLPAPAEFRVLSYNVHNFFPASVPGAKSAESKAAVIDVVAGIDAAIMLLVETGGQESVREIQDMLRRKGCEYPFSSVVEGGDQERRLAVLAKWEPVEVQHDVTAFYNLGGLHVRVQRGFANCTFQWANGYRLHLLGAHLKSKVYHQLGQTDMRRYEARQLRYLVNGILDKEPDANILVVGDMNDSPNASPVTTLLGRRYKDEKQLYDLRPLDRYDLAWTHLWQAGDVYSRIDYALATYGLLPEVDLDKTCLPELGSLQLASDHRPLVVTLTPVEKSMAAAVLDRFDQSIRKVPNAVPTAEAERMIGTRKARRAEEQDNGSEAGDTGEE